MIHHKKNVGLFVFMMCLFCFFWIVGCDSSISSKAFLEAAYLGDLSAMKTYIDHGGDVTVREDEVPFSTALHRAARKGHAAGIKLLLENGLDVNVREDDESQSTALHIAASEGYPQCIKVLIQYGADVDAQDGYGNTPLQVAKTDEIKQLLIHAMKSEQQSFYFMFNG